MDIEDIIFARRVLLLRMLVYNACQLLPVCVPHTYGTRVAVRLVCCSADAVVRAWNVSKCVLLGGALADFLVWLLFAVTHALYTCRFFFVLVTPQY